MGLLEVVAAVRPIVVRVPEASGGISPESILVFIGGTLAATAAVIAAIITTRGASTRLEQQLQAERDRFSAQLEEEANRFREQLEHDRWQTKWAEASMTVERISRLVARTMSQFDELVPLTLEEERSGMKKIEKSLMSNLDEIREEISIVAMRFGNRSPLIDKMMELLSALKAALVKDSEFPLSDTKKTEIQEAADRAGAPAALFLVAAKQVLDEY